MALSQRSELSAHRNLNWTAPTPRIQPWSGVREKSYTLDNRLAFAGVGQGDKPPPEPFDFIVQIAFTSPPYAAVGTPWFEEGAERETEEASEKAEQEAPWLLSDADLHTTENVLTLIAQEPRKRDVFDGMREFVWLERLFRAGLSGKLGADFPVERLAELAEKTALAVSKQRTPRWNIRAPTELSFLVQLLQAIKPGADYERKLAACAATVGIDAPKVGRDQRAIEAAVTAARSRLYTLRDDDWDRTCRFEGGVPQSLAEVSTRVGDLRRLRHALGLREDEALLQRGTACGPL